MRQILLLAILLPIQTACSNPLTYFHDELKRHGYIPYTTPLRYAGTGTLIGGNPQQMALVASPQTCFSEADDSSLKLRFRDETTLPKKSEHFFLTANVALELIKSSPLVRVKAGFRDIKTVELKFDGVHIEYMDSIRLYQYYNESMSDTCRDFLDRVGFVIQAIAADSVSFHFYHENGGMVQLDANKVKELLDIGIDIQWEVRNNTSLVISSTQYLGYQLGTLRRHDRGLSLLRASKVFNNKWVFTDIAIAHRGRATWQTLDPKIGAKTSDLPLDEYLGAY